MCGLASKTFLPAKCSTSGGEAARLVHRAVDVEAVAQAGQVVVPAVARGGVDHAGAGVEGDVVAEHGGRVARRSRGGGSAAPPARVPLTSNSAGPSARRPTGRAPGRGLVPQALGERAAARRCPSTGVEAVVEVGVEGERQVGRQRPGRGGPDHRGDTLAPQLRRALRPARPARRRQREAHVDLRADVVVVVLDLGLGQRGAAGDAPVHRLLGLVDQPLLDELGQRPHDGAPGRRAPWSGRARPTRP